MNQPRSEIATVRSTKVPPISVGVPVYNGEKYLRVALCAAEANVADFEIIICDNASTDATQAIAQEYAARDPRIRYVRSAKNIGANGNFHYVFTLPAVSIYGEVVEFTNTGNDAVAHITREVIGEK